MPKRSAGLLMFRRSEDGLHVLLVHPGGPFWKNKDLGAWTIPKGEPDAGEEALACQAGGGQDGRGLGLRGGCGRGRDPQQHLLDRMAARIRALPGFPRSRSSGVVLSR